MKRSLFPVIAIVDDDPENRLLLKTAFENCRKDLRLHLYKSSDALLDYLNRCGKVEEQESMPDLIVSDLHLTGQNIFELITQIKTNPDLKSIPLVVLTGSPFDEEIKRCYDLGANTVVTKPDFFNDLVGALRILCDYWFGPVRM
jgi:CheY-like chemotaxis protein